MHLTPAYTCMYCYILRYNRNIQAADPFLYGENYLCLLNRFTYIRTLVFYTYVCYLHRTTFFTCFLLYGIAKQLCQALFKLFIHNTYRIVFSMKKFFTKTIKKVAYKKIQKTAWHRFQPIFR